MLGARLWEVVRRHRAGRALLLMIDVLDLHHAPIAASAIAFDAFLSLVPLAAFAGMVMHRLHESDLILRPLLRASPAPVADLVGGAVTRNRCKRRLREAARLLLPVLGHPGFDYVFIARQGTADRDWPRLLDDVKSALVRLAAEDGVPGPGYKTASGRSAPPTRETTPSPKLPSISSD